MGRTEMPQAVFDPVLWQGRQETRLVGSKSALLPIGSRRLGKGDGVLQRGAFAGGLGTGDQSWAELAGPLPR